MLKDSLRFFPVRVQVFPPKVSSALRIIQQFKTWVQILALHYYNTLIRMESEWVSEHSVQVQGSLALIARFILPLLFLPSEKEFLSEFSKIHSRHDQQRYQLIKQWSGHLKSSRMFLNSWMLKLSRVVQNNPARAASLSPIQFLKFSNNYHHYFNRQNKVPYGALAHSTGARQIANFVTWHARARYERGPLPALHAFNGWPRARVLSGSLWIDPGTRWWEEVYKVELARVVH